MIDTILGVYERYGFAPLETPTLEFADVLGKYLPDVDVPDGGVFAFRDEGSHWVALRYDLTAPLSRVVAQYPDLPSPFRRYQVGPVFRQEKPGPGRYREFYQCDFDTVGTASMTADAEVACILSDAMEALGIERGSYVVRVNNRKVLNGVLDKAGVLTADDSSDQWMTVLRAIDKLDRVGIEGVLELLGPGREDVSGDFTPGAGLTPAQIEPVHRYLDLPRTSRTELCAALAELVAGSTVGEEGVDEMNQIESMLRAIGYDEDRVVFDPTVVRGLAYYTGPVFETELTFEVTDDEGETHRFGSVAGGGRYDDLVERFLGRLVPATGASIGVDRLLAALEQLGLTEKAADQAPVMVTVMDTTRMADYMALAAELRADGIAAEVFLGTGGLRAQLKYADRRDLPAVVICGEDEMASGTVSIKDMARGRELSAEVDDRETWRRERPAQVSVPRAEMSAAVREMLDAYRKG
jgi:histidyl-tRNA synthetase